MNENKELAQRKGRKAKGGLHDEFLHFIKNYDTSLKSNRLETWEDLKEKFDNAAMIVASFIPAERLFSKDGITPTQQMNRLKLTKLNELLFLSGIGHKNNDFNFNRVIQ